MPRSVRQLQKEHGLKDLPKELSESIIEGRIRTISTESEKISNKIKNEQNKEKKNN